MNEQTRVPMLRQLILLLSAHLLDVIRGVWISSEKGEIDFSNSTVSGYTLTMFSAKVHLQLQCMEEKNGRYILRTVTQAYTLYLYVCLEFHQVSENVFWYQVGNTVDNNERVFASHLQTLTVADGCNRTEPYETATFNTLVKRGSTEQGFTAVMCPQDLYHTFIDGVFMSATGQASCRNNELDVCEDRTHVITTYGQCSPELKLASAGSYLCLLAFTDDLSGVTYLHMWNNDSSTGETLIHCMAYMVTDTALFATVYPGSCWTNQTAGVVDRPGIKMQFDNITNSCQDRHEVVPSLIGLYAGAAAGGVVFLLLLILLACCIYKTRCRCIARLCKTSRVRNSDKLLTSSQEDVSVNSLSKDAIFVANGHGINMSPVVIPDLHPPPKVELLYQVEPKSTCSKSVFDSSVFLSDLSLRSK